MMIQAYKCDVCGKLYETEEHMTNCYDRCIGKINFNILMKLNNEEERNSEIDIGFTYEYWKDLYENGRDTWYCLSFDSDVICLTERELDEFIVNLKKIKDYRKLNTKELM